MLGQFKQIYLMFGQFKLISHLFHLNVIDTGNKFFHCPENIVKLEKLQNKSIQKISMRSNTWVIP